MTGGMWLVKWHSQAQEKGPSTRGLPCATALVLLFDRRDPLVQFAELLVCLRLHRQERAVMLNFCNALCDLFEPGKEVPAFGTLQGLPPREFCGPCHLGLRSVRRNADPCRSNQL